MSDNKLDTILNKCFEYYCKNEVIGDLQKDSSFEDFKTGFRYCVLNVLFPFCTYLDDIEGGEKFTITELNIFLKERIKKI